jgi:hypothetical protein
MPPDLLDSAAGGVSPTAHEVRTVTGMLRELDPSELTSFTRDLLLERPPAATTLDRRQQELPYHPLLAAYRAGENGLRDQFGRVALSLLREAAAESWEVLPLHYLFTFIEEAPIQAAAEPLEALVHSGAWLRQPQGAQRQMLALRTLLGLGWYGEPNFWVEQYQRLGRAYPELTFRALANHGLEQAFSRLPKLARTSEDALKLLRLFPTLIKQHSLAVIKPLTEKAMTELVPEVAAEFEDWFRSREYGSVAADHAAARRAATEPESFHLGGEPFEIPEFPLSIAVARLPSDPQVWLPGLISSATDYLARLPGVTDREEAIELAHEAIAESWSFLLDESRSTEQKVRRLATTLDAAGKRARVTQKRHRKLLEDYAANLRYFTPVQSLEEQIIQKDHVLGVVRVLDSGSRCRVGARGNAECVRLRRVATYALRPAPWLRSHASLSPPRALVRACRTGD